MVGGALVMALFATIVHRGWLREALGHGRTIVHGLIPIAVAQLCYYNASANLSVGVAPARIPRRVRGRMGMGHDTAPAGDSDPAGAALALAGTIVVLDVFSGASNIIVLGTGRRGTAPRATS